MQTRHPLANAVVTREWDDAYSWSAECARREEERAKPYPVITPCLLAVFAIAVFAVNLAVFGKGAW